ncbi:hypothetical protein COT72_01110 [archaeon CG10_big_fil_rev_8_21_14_0_10_43_11]|nr:MAG: hypothetical protein COT72_01110 [archaeon CG10_big_fil_rev_8_21_14_0_10_43_11]
MRLETWDDMVYSPREDSFALLWHVKALCKGNMLDMGCGSGILGIGAALRGCTVTCADLNPLALSLTEKNAEHNKVTITTVLSNLFENIDETFDFMSFNPPYLPNEQRIRVDLMGGKKGNEITINFLKQAKKHLSKEGVILITVSSLSQADETFGAIRELGYCYDLLETKKFDFERLYLVKIMHASSRM